MIARDMIIPGDRSARPFEVNRMLSPVQLVHSPTTIAVIVFLVAVNINELAYSGLRFLHVYLQGFVTLMGPSHGLSLFKIVIKKCLCHAT